MTWKWNNIVFECVSARLYNLEMSTLAHFHSLNHASPPFLSDLSSDVYLSFTISVSVANINFELCVLPFLSNIVSYFPIRKKRSSN